MALAESLKSMDSEIPSTASADPRHHTPYGVEIMHCNGRLEKLMKRIFSLLILMVGSVAIAGETGSQEPASAPSETATVGRSGRAVPFVSRAVRMSLCSPGNGELRERAEFGSTQRIVFLHD